MVKNFDELYKKFKLQVDLLNLSCANFDSGQEIAGYQLATTIRVLVHDTNTSTSALKHIEKKNITFLDTSHKERPNSTYLGLLYSYAEGVGNGSDGIVLYKPNYTNVYNPNYKSEESWVSFDDWWNKIIFRNINGTSLTRRELILKIANKEGGAHIDESVDNKYELFSKHYSGGIRITDRNTGAIRIFDNIPVLPAARQIAFELLKSFQNASL